MNIINLPIEYDKAKIDSRYRLVVIASQRAKELALGAPTRLESSERHKDLSADYQRFQTKELKEKKIPEHRVSTLSLMEIMEDKITYLKGDKAVEARERAEKIDFKKIIDDKRRSLEDLSELEKDLKVYLHEKESSRKDIDDYFFEAEDADLE